MPSLTAQATFNPNPKRDNSLGAEKCFTIIQDKQIIYLNLYSHKSYLLWAIKWNNLASGQSDFYFYSVREKERITAAFLQHLSSLVEPFFFSLVYKLSLHNILVYSSSKEISIQSSLYLAAKRGPVSALFLTSFLADSSADFEKFFGPRISLRFSNSYSSETFAVYKKFLLNLFYLLRERYTEVPWFICPFRQVGAEIWKRDINFIPLFFQFGFVFPITFSLLKQMTPVGYYLYFYGELLRPYFSYRKIYTINWP